MNISSYFPHNNNARNDEKIIGVRMDYGCEGYGIYFMILERLGESEDYTCAANYKRLAFDFHCEEKTVQAIVEDYDLFCFTDDGERFYSLSYIERMQAREEARAELSQKRAEAGRKGGIKSQIVQANSKQMQANAQANENFASKQNKQIEASKVKESKVKESKSSVCVSNDTAHTPSETESEVQPTEPPPKISRFQKPTIEQIQQYCLERNNGIDAERFFNYYESNGWRVGRNPMRDWKAAVRTWERQETQLTPISNENNNHQTTIISTGAAEGKPYQRIQELGRTKFNLDIH